MHGVAKLGGRQGDNQTRSKNGILTFTATDRYPGKLHPRIRRIVKTRLPGYAVGFCAGELRGNHDWVYTDGMACGSCFTSGRYAAIHAMTEGLTPGNPVAWEEIMNLCEDAKVLKDA